MIRYSLSSPVPSSRYIRVEACFPIEDAKCLSLQLSSWRPGRYELGNFAKNIRGVKAVDSLGHPLQIQKVSKDCWRVENAPVGVITITYDYYSAQPDAGACWVDDELFYINPVHCILFDIDRMSLPVELTLDLPQDWQVASALKQSGRHTLLARDIHHLVDSPVMASRALRHRTYSVDEYQFHIWMHGESRPSWDRILADFQAFTKVQLQMMGSFPVSEFHFLVLLLPFPFYHGVEHTESTVLALGPGYKLMTPDNYADFLGVASHELFHVWNVKTLRPSDFIQYDYTRENYSRLGWVYEGFTTYYGDLFLCRSGFFDEKAFFNELNLRLQRHADNFGCLFSSVAESSFDTWLDGYVPGAPGRKTSIYDEGCLIALILDLYIRKGSRGKASLDDLFIRLYNDFAARGKGYTEADIARLAISLSDEHAVEIFSGAIRARTSYIGFLEELLPEVGCVLSKKSSSLLHESRFGLRTLVEGGMTKVAMVLPGSPAEGAGISRDDEILACNGWKVEGNLGDLTGLSDEFCELMLASQKKIRKVFLKMESTTWFDKLSISRNPDAGEDARREFEKWTGKS